MSEKEKTQVGNVESEVENNEKKETNPMEKLQEEVNKWKNDYLYLRAEFDNFRKQSIKERSDLIKYGPERFLSDFVEVIDNLDRALLATPTTDTIESYVQGVQMIAGEFKALMAKHGVTTEDCLKTPFDPIKHEALGTEPTNELPPGHVTRVIKSPYRLHDKLLRPAQVLVAVEKN